MSGHHVLILAAATVISVAGSARASIEMNRLSSLHTLPNVTLSGLLLVDEAANASMFYAYYDAQQAPQDDTPILLWLQVIC